MELKSKMAVVLFTLLLRDVDAVLCGMFITFSFCLAIRAFTQLLTSNLTPYFLNVQTDSVTVTLTVTPTTTNDVILTSTFNISIIFYNLNHQINISYKSLEAKIWFENDNFTLASMSLPSFSQGAENATRIGFFENATRIETQLTVVHVANGMGEVMGQDGSMNFGVSLFGWVRFEHGVMRSRVVPLRIECNRIIVFPTGRIGMSL